jgi:hypothetical protein
MQEEFRKQGTERRKLLMQGSHTVMIEMTENIGGARGILIAPSIMTGRGKWS